MGTDINNGILASRDLTTIDIEQQEIETVYKIVDNQQRDQQKSKPYNEQTVGEVSYHNSSHDLHNTVKDDNIGEFRNIRLEQKREYKEMIQTDREKAEDDAKMEQRLEFNGTASDAYFREVLPMEELNSMKKKVCIFADGFSKVNVAKLPLDDFDTDPNMHQSVKNMINLVKDEADMADQTGSLMLLKLLNNKQDQVTREVRVHHGISSMIDRFLFEANTNLPVIATQRMVQSPSIILAASEPLFLNLLCDTKQIHCKDAIKSVISEAPLQLLPCDTKQIPHRDVTESVISEAPRQLLPCDTKQIPHKDVKESVISEAVIQLPQYDIKQVSHNNSIGTIASSVSLLALKFQ